jgi:hypothetical protein
MPAAVRAGDCPADAIDAVAHLADLDIPVGTQLRRIEHDAH